MNQDLNIDNLNIKLKIKDIVNNSCFEVIMMIFVIANLLFMMIETDKNMYSRISGSLHYFNIFIVIIFSVEYTLRLLSLKKANEILKPMIIIDTVAMLSFLPMFLTNLSFLRILRLSRIFRILKLARYSEAMQNIGKVFYNKREELSVAGLAFFIALIISAFTMYFAEGHIQKCFSSVFKTLWWAVVTFTSVGYGDACPITPIGKIIAAISAILGIGFHGVFIGVLGSGFMDEIKANKNVV